eukprot:TRINITY_DN16867_c0_g1_i1.p1 TRINITY_DN16867_c0_g1~~TRINITY_DN16867_c0_g1_i1.p1  ORF type:complete len:352 (+),score=35.62 TRINITY_DN16867_c0_g1_i1:126-1058(+)
MQEPAWGLLGMCSGAAAPTLPSKNPVLTAHGALFFHHQDMPRQLLTSARAARNAEICSPQYKGIASLVEKGNRTTHDCKAKEDRQVAWSGFRQFRIASIRKVADEFAEVTFVPIDSCQESFDFAPGQYLTIKPAQETVPPHRCFVTSAPRRNYLQCCLQRRDVAGHEIKLNSVVGVLAPSGRCCPAGRPKVLVSSGIGAAPMKSFLEGDQSEVQFVLHVDNTEASHPFRREFRRSCVETFFHYTSMAGPASPDMLVKMLRPHLACDFVLCGPAAFVRRVENELKYLGANTIHSLMLHEVSATAGQLEPGL